MEVLTFVQSCGAFRTEEFCMQLDKLIVLSKGR
jgi:hypothetical protein